MKEHLHRILWVAVANANHSSHSYEFASTLVCHRQMWYTLQSDWLMGNRMFIYPEMITLDDKDVHRSHDVPSIQGGLCTRTDSDWLDETN